MAFKLLDRQFHSCAVFHSAADPKPLRPRVQQARNASAAPDCDIVDGLSRLAGCIARSPAGSVSATTL
ncbi:hypothetical protein XH80_40215 [Bradyrhizobium sp. CCBAU 45384]|nr:hypothetical protein [Bradyrhizobium sp. CCBAU 45384]